MHVIAIVPAYVLVHRTTGQQVSIHGAVPWFTDAQRKDWQLVANRWTLETSDNTFITGSSTHTLAVQRAETINEARIDGLVNHAQHYPDQVLACEIRINAIKAVKFDRYEKTLPMPSAA